MTKIRSATLTFVGLGALTGVAAPLLANQPTVASGSGLVGTGTKSVQPKLPVTFVENRGQTDARVHYFARGSRYAFFLTSKEVVLSLVKTAGATQFDAAHLRDASLRGNEAKLLQARSMPHEAAQSRVERTTLDLQFLNSNPGVSITGADRRSGSVNYLHGANAANWQTNVPTYNEVIYRELWRGVELRVSEKEGTLKYEFYVRPRARVENIRLAYRGVKCVALDSTGGLAIDTGAGTIHDSAPVSFQEIGGRRIPVESSYVLQAGTGGAYGFRIGPGYQPDKELIIDPGIEYSTYLGGAADDVPTGIAVDATGNAYVVGYTQSTDFPVTAGAFDRTGSVNNSLDAFVAKINPSGTAFVYATYIGGSNFDWGRAIAIDAAGNAYIAGQTQSSDFPVTGKAFQKSLAHLNCPRCSIDNYDAFVAKLNPSGSALVYSTYLGGASSIDDALGIAIDAAGNAYVTGETSSPDFPTTAGAFRRTIGGGDDTYVSKLNATGSALLYSTFVGGALEEFPARITLDAANQAIVFGNTSSADFPTTLGAFQTAPGGRFDAFLFKLNATGTNLVYSTFLGGSANDSATGLNVDALGDVYVGGFTSSPNFPTTPGAFQPVCTGSDGFVTKLNPTASALVYSTCISNAGVGAIALTPTGRVWFTGSSSGGFPTTPDAFQSFPAVGPSGPMANATIAELNETGSAFLYATYIGGTSGDSGRDIGLDAAGDVYVVGRTASNDFPTTPNAIDRVFNGRADIFWGDGFAAKLALNGTPPPPPAPPAIASIAVNGSNFVGGSSFSINVTLSTGAQTGGAVIGLASSSPAVAVPATMTIPAGAQNGTITVNSAQVLANTAVTITGAFGGLSKSATITLLPVPAAGTLSSLGLVPNTVTSGGTTLGIIGLNNPAGSGGYTVTLSANNPIASFPSTVTVPAGETTASFSVSVGAVTQTTGLTIFAKAGTLSALAPLTVNAPPPAVTTSTLAVTATGRSGVSVTSSPAGINVAVGSSAQASFTTGRVITLSVSSGRDAIWSGSCSSGGGKAKTCTLTLNSNAGVTANVQ